MATGSAAGTALGARVLLACMMWALVAFPATAETFDCNAANASPPPSDVTIALDPATPWQPRGGTVRVILRSVTQALKDVDVTVCFRWSGVGNGVKYLPPAAVQLVEATAAKVVYDVTLPDGSALPAVRSSWFGRLLGVPPVTSPPQPTQFDNLMIVPIADAVVIVGTSDNVLAATVLQVGITSVWNAVLTTLVAVLVAHGLLYLWAVRRQVPGHSPWMRLVSTREGYASLSQAQIMIWSFLFGAGAVYVMILSGSLFNIPNTALVLLGISGATTLGAKIQMANARTATVASDLPAATDAPGPVQGLRVIATTDHSVTLDWQAPAGSIPAVFTVSCARRAFADWLVVAERIANTSFRATRLVKDTLYDFDVVAANVQGSSAACRVAQQTLAASTTGPREPKWSDLVVTSQHRAEIDVTRVQMLFFTLISASFVAIKLITSYAIPEIPDGFMLLMGISNGVYLSAKFVPD
jgi:hypothetical protein